MTDLQEAQKVQAAELLHKLTDMYYRLEYESGTVYIFDPVGFLKKLKASGKIAAKVKELREQGNEVYAVLIDRTDFGRCCSFLIVPKYPEDWDKLYRPSTSGSSMVYAYVWNTTYEECSESGYIAVKFFDGILRRVG